jgi:hypothetical protein
MQARPKMGAEARPHHELRSLLVASSIRSDWNEKGQGSPPHRRANKPVWARQIETCCSPISAISISPVQIRFCNPA